MQLNHKTGNPNMTTSHNFHWCQFITAQGPDTMNGNAVTLTITTETDTHNITLFDLPEDAARRLVDGCNDAPSPTIDGTKPQVPWDAMSDDIQWVARDEDGEFAGYMEKPIAGPDYWAGNGLNISTVKINPGTCDWRDSLVQRPAK
jgi:hypothetical protein